MRDNGAWSEKTTSAGPRAARAGDRPSPAEVQARLEALVPLLKAGRLDEAIPKLESFTRWAEPSAAVLYNLGLALSQHGRFDEAILRLKRAVQLDPTHDNAWVGLGVAQGKMGQSTEAKASFERALEIDSDNPYAHRNIAGWMIVNGRFEEAHLHLERAARLLPNDPQVIVGQAMVAEAQGKASGKHAEMKRAEALYLQVIALAPASEAAEAAREALTAMSRQSFERRRPRPDVMMYILGALQRFEKEGRAKSQAMTLEIALLGQGGLQVHNPDRKYRIKSAPGAEFTGLHLLSIMYAGMRLMGLPMADFGADFSLEFDAAQALMGPSGRTSKKAD